MKPQRVAATALAALLTLAACAENPVAPVSDAGYTAISPSFARASGRSYTFRQFDVPLSFQTVPSGINAAGVIVGWYFSGSGCPSAPCAVKGFIFKDGVFTTVVYHNADGTNAALTQLRGIGPSGEIVGSYRMAGETAVTFHGFILTTGGEFVPVDYPGYNTIPQRILPDGTILGCYHGTDQMLTMHGIWKDKYGFSAVERATTMNNGGTPSGRKIAGLFTDMPGTAAEKGRGYVIEDGVFTPFDAPGSDWTTAWDMNPAGTIVGWFEEDGTSKDVHGYVLEQWRVLGGELSGTYTTISFPVTPSANAAYTDVFGINAAGDIVGKFRESATTGPFHGYIATRKAGE
jgi:hypothetical protein